MRTIVLSDCHGQPWLIENALNHAKSWDRVIFAGDFLDIGYDDTKCLDMLEEVGAEMMWGNHELAILLNKHIVPQNKSSFEWFGYLLCKYTDKSWRAAICVEDVLITHAGVCEDYLLLYGRCDGVKDFARELDVRFHANAETWWRSHSPIWYRPEVSIPPIEGIIQVCGHTPSMYVPEFNGFYIVDPYEDGFNNSVYKYATIEDGNVLIYNGRIDASKQ